MRAIQTRRGALTALGTVLGLSLMLGLGACASGRPGSAADLPAASVFEALLPLPRQLPEPAPVPRQASDESQISLPGTGYDLSLGLQNVGEQQTGVAGYAASYSPGGTLDSLAYAFYSFTLGIYSGPPELHLGWVDPPPAQTIWIGLANYAENRWDWFANPVNSVLPLDLASGNYASPTGLLHVAVVNASSTDQSLATITLGSNTPPVLKFPQFFVLTNPGVTTTIDASPSYDPDGSIVKFEFDPEKDGSFVDKGSLSSITHSYTASGVHPCAVRITDNDGAITSGEEFLRVSWQHSLIGAPGENSSSAMLLDLGESTLYAAGTLQGAGQGGEEGFIGAYDSADGTLLWEKSWGGTGNDGFFSLAQDSAGDLYAAGRRDNFADTCIGVLVKFKSDGSLVWQKSWNGILTDQPHCLADDAGHVYFCAERHTIIGSPVQLLVAQLDLDGGVNWEKSYSSPDDWFLYDCSLDADGNVYVCGSTSAIAVVEESGYVLSLDNAGGLRFASSMSSSPGMRFYGIGWSDALMYLTGERDTAGASEALAAGMDSGGVLQWVESFTTGVGATAFYGHPAAIIEIGGAIIPGIYHPDTFADLLAVELRPDGSLGVTQGFGVANQNDSCECIAFGSAGDLYWGGHLSAQAGAGFAEPGGTVTGLSLSLDPILGPSLADDSITLDPDNKTYADLSGVTRDSGGAIYMQAFMPFTL